MSDQAAGAPEPKKNMLWTILGWIVTVVVGVPGIMLLFSAEIIPGIAFILAALVACPLVVDMLASRANVSLPGWARILGIIVLLGIGGGTSKLPQSAPAPAQQTAEQQPADQGAAQQPAERAQPAAPAAPAAPLLELDGQGSKSTQKFTTAGNDWAIEYSYDCSALGYQGNFAAIVKKDAGDLTGMQINKLGTKGEDTEHFHEGGTFYLEIISSCTWHISVKDE